MWTAGSVARRLGIAPATLRTWHHRYGIGPTVHRAGSYRRYTERDIAVLETMSRLVGQGVVPAAAAAIAREHVAAPAPPDEPAMPITGRAPRGLVQAAVRLDADTLRHALDEALAAHGLEATWNDLCVPALTALGRKVTPEGRCVDAVLLLSWVIIASLHRTAGVGAATSSSSRVLLACTDGERHSLGLEALHAMLTVNAVPSRMLGASVPTTVLASAGQRIRPAAAVIWSQVPRTARTAALRTMTTLAETTIAAGPGWDGVRLPDGVERVASLREAVDAVTGAVTIGVLPSRPQQARDQAPDEPWDDIEPGTA